MPATRALRSLDSDDRLAASWGFAEAILFFVIPDVFLTYVALQRGVKKALRVSLLAALAAVVGGVVTYAWGGLDFESGASAMQALPGIDHEMVAAVEAEVAADGNAALLSGPRQGRPYKLYALAAGQLATGVFSLMVITLPGRLWRFVVFVVVAAAAGSLLRRITTGRVITIMWGSCWFVVYVWFWFMRG